MTELVATVIIVNYNSGRRLAKCLACLTAQTRRDFQIIVIDNQSTDGSAAAASATAAVKFIQAGENIGFAAGNNRAAREAKGDWLVFLNPDAYAAPDWFEELMKGAARYPFAEAFGSTQINAGDESRLDGIGDVFHVLGLSYRSGFGWPVEKTPSDGECFAVCAAAAMYARARFVKLGGFDESFFCYGEDADLGFRLRLAGGRAVQLSDARVFHEGSGVTGRHSNFTVYHSHRNRIWTTYKNMPGIIYWPTAPFRAAFDLYLILRFAMLGLAPVYLRALRDGYGGLAILRARRREIQRTRVVGVGAIARILKWSPLAMVRRTPSFRPITPSRE